ncbi:hypothetical protein FB451DRAFT_1240663, partial [Mycena latifolia]
MFANLISAAFLTPMIFALGQGVVAVPQTSSCMWYAWRIYCSLPAPQMIPRLVSRTLLAPASSAAALILSIRLWEAIYALPCARSKLRYGARILATKRGQRFWMAGKMVEGKVSPWHESHKKKVGLNCAGREAPAAHPVVSDIY